MPTLYDIDAQLAALAAAIQDADGEVDDETSDAFDALLDAREDKADAHIALIKNAEADALALAGQIASFQPEIDRLTARKKSATALAERLKNRLLDSMGARNEKTITGRLGTIRRQRSVSKSVEILVDPHDLPERFRRETVEPNKTALKAALAEQDPDAIQSAVIVERESFNIRIS